jgi:hypothetical protein
LLGWFFVGLVFGFNLGCFFFFFLVGSWMLHFVFYKVGNNP